MFLEQSYLFYYKILFMLELLGATFLLTFNLKKRNNFIVRLIIGIIACLLITILFPLFKNISYTWWYSSIMFMFFFVCVMGLLMFVYDEAWQKIFFIAIIGYTIQHFAHEIYSLFANALNLVETSSMGIYSSDVVDLANLSINVLQSVLYLDIYIAVYIFLYFFFGKRMRNNDVKVSSISILAITMIILLTDIILNSVLVYSKTYNRMYSIIVSIYNILCCAMIFYIQFAVTKTKVLENELQITSRLLHLSEDKYRESKENIDMINLKCHDLKHQIREFASKSSISQETINGLEDLINIYDSNMKTGNEALNLILTEKSLLCQKQNIKLTCLADCTKLGFINNEDLYSLFGNAIDNAIEAVMKINDPEKRSINLIVRNVHSFISITIENYYVGEIFLDSNGLPKTTKSNKDYHGFGTKSIKMIVNKYNGDLKITTKKNIFTLAILFQSK